MQVQIGTHAFTFDHVYGNGGSPSSDMFGECVAPLVDGLFQGYNATVLAYGQVISILFKSGLKFNKVLHELTCKSPTDWIWQNIHHGYWPQRRLPDRIDSASYECSIQQN